MNTIKVNNKVIEVHHGIGGYTHSMVYQANANDVIEYGPSEPKYLLISILKKLDLHKEPQFTFTIPVSGYYAISANTVVGLDIRRVK